MNYCGREDLKHKLELVCVNVCLIWVKCSRLWAKILVITRNRISLRKGFIQTDLTDLENALANDQIASVSEMLIAIGTKPMLDQLHLAPAFEDWRTRQRQDVKQRLRSSVKNALISLEGSNKLTDYHRLLDA